MCQIGAFYLSQSPFQFSSFLSLLLLIPTRLALRFSLSRSPFVEHFSHSSSLFHLTLLSSDILNQGITDNVPFSLSTLLNSFTSVFCCFYLCLFSLVVQEDITLSLIPAKMKSQNSFCSHQTHSACLIEYKVRKAPFPLFFFNLCMQHKGNMFSCQYSLCAFLSFIGSGSKLLVG